MTELLASPPSPSKVGVAGRNVVEVVPELPPPSDDVIAPRGTTAPPNRGDTLTYTLISPPLLHVSKGMDTYRVFPLLLPPTPLVVVVFVASDDEDEDVSEVAHVLLPSLSDHVGRGPPTAMALKSLHAGW